MLRTKLTMALTGMIALVSVSSSADLKGKLAERSDRAAVAIQELTQAPDQAIPAALLDRATCVMVIPSEKKVGYVFGLKYGRGLASCRTQNGWSAPSYMMITGPSFGWQIGIKATDVVLVFTRANASDAVSSDSLALTAAAGISVGPVGRDAEIGSDVNLSSILSYSRSGGLFLGATLEGSVVKPDLSANAEIYGQEARPKAIVLTSGVTAPQEVQSLVSALNQYAPARK